MERFWTKGERVLVTDEEFRVESGLLTQARRYWRGSKVLFCFVYVVSPALLVLLGVDSLRGGEWNALLAGAVLAAVVYVAVVGYYRRIGGFSTDDRIPLAAVERVVDEEWGNPRLVVEYRTDGGRKRRRLLMASSRFADGVTEFETAMGILRERKIPVERED